MEGMRDVLRSSLGKALRGMEPVDRLAAAWTVACGPALAGRGTVVGYDSSVVHVQVEQAIWLAQMISIRGMLAHRMASASGLTINEIRFELKKRESDERR